MRSRESTLETQEVWRERPPAHRRLLVRYGGGILLSASLLAGAACANSSPQDKSRPYPTGNSNNVSISNATPTRPVPKPGPAVLLPDSHHQEIEQFGAGTFTDYTHAYGIGPVLPKGTAVDVDCVAEGPAEAAPSANEIWYHIDYPASYAGYYAAANTFENGGSTGPLNTQPAVDPAVPDCPPPSTPGAAIRDGAGLLGIGRQITQADDPPLAYAALVTGIEEALS